MCASKATCAGERLSPADAAPGFVLKVSQGDLDVGDVDNPRHSRDDAASSSHRANACPSAFAPRSVPPPATLKQSASSSSCTTASPPSGCSPRSPDGDSPSVVGSPLTSSCASAPAAEPAPKPPRETAVATNTGQRRFRVHALLWQSARFLSLCQLDERDLRCQQAMVRAIDMLYRCDYSVEDVCATLAHACVYFVQARADGVIDESQVLQTLVLCVYIAHSYVLDESCVLDMWRLNVLPYGCTTKGLDREVGRLIMHRGYVLRVGDACLAKNFAALLEACGVGPSALRRAMADAFPGCAVLYAFCATARPRPSVLERGLQVLALT
eukprot:CAMPEP_0117507026 /NCGR_PEP_ID=MMETSP0784-20121206/26214_1 /TAXON_ID=39447 /ORGANISM="" /LENGTH=325 /DNA_ID=CAMNT_0005302523 /DNA_START=96 /DNA_END=1074 /DNA_ORIENTATION=+